MNPLLWLKLRRKRTVDVQGHAILVSPGVLDPILFRSGAWFAKWVAQQDIKGKTLLDLGCGTGVVGVLAKAAGAQVVASDIDPRACDNARQNGLNEVHQRDLLQGAAAFQIICFNPPYFVGTVDRHHLLGKALYGGENLEVIRRFSARVQAHLTPGGVAWVVLSDKAPNASSALGKGWQAIARGTTEDEQLSVWALSSAVP